MKKYFLILAAVFASSPASAMIMVSNNDDVPHHLVLESIGRVHEYTIQPGETIRDHGVSVKLIMDGGNLVRTSAGDRYIIWPSGLLHIQSRRVSAPGRMRF